MSRSQGREWSVDPASFARIADAHTAAANPELAERFAIAIENLPDDLAVLVNAVVWERVSKRELARRMKVHRPVIDKRLAKAFEMIRDSMGWSTDAYYEVKKAEGLLTGVEAYLSEDEVRSTMVGRSRGDGRRMDCYASDTPAAWPPLDEAA